MSRRAYPTPPTTAPGSSYYTRAKELPKVVQEYLERTDYEVVQQEWFALHFPDSGPRLPGT